METSFTILFGFLVGFFCTPYIYYLIFIFPFELVVREHKIWSAPWGTRVARLLGMRLRNQPIGLILDAAKELKSNQFGYDTEILEVVYFLNRHQIKTSRDLVTLVMK